MITSRLISTIEGIIEGISKRIHTGGKKELTRVVLLIISCF
jgi:hypothetical protein